MGELREDLNKKLNLWRKTLKVYGLCISRSKTKYMECKFGLRRENPNIEVKIGENIIQKVKSFKYLGCIIQDNEEIEHDVNHRIQAGWSKWRSASSFICDKTVPLKLKCWTVKGEHEHKLSVSEMKMLRWMSGRMQLDKIRNEDIRERVGVASIVKKMVESHLWWFGHVRRRPTKHLVRRVDEMEDGQGVKCRGRSKKTIHELVKRDLHHCKPTPPPQGVAYCRVRRTQSSPSVRPSSFPRDPSLQPLFAVTDRGCFLELGVRRLCLPSRASIAVCLPFTFAFFAVHVLHCSRSLTVHRSSSHSCSSGSHVGLLQTLRPTRALHLAVELLSFVAAVSSLNPPPDNTLTQHQYSASNSATSDFYYNAESKSNRKLDKKVQFYSVKDAVASLSAQKSITKKNSKQQRRQKKKLKAYDLSALSEFLPDPEPKAPRKPAPQDVKVNCKSRQKILREVQQFCAVLNNPDFKTNPRSAMNEHLRSTLPVAEEQRPKKKVNKNGSKKKKKSKASSTGLMSMDM
uniref:Putative reverse transcriptase n=1 Tax=Arachis hypogaea TaxID=3818 RepID=C0L2V9_ARAHY|nr:putative reverse transcriptase [Arachis hypogaea]